ncbi:hypothetical protein GW933_03075 [Candidatus Falkowbacteria bacterium]|uniref:Uncharacterized protein n=1 Tax=Candidatus Buchananbacteria bacterium CG10_big_fil_rev_8_21_14_0_10_33_19 TaxID=1974525 RepID=A0A2H0W4K5_9BACT|nr:hypothetical protein [Candidatus Falkowbacteria bacterium]PIS06288.1 MAG: hypothetical protein COT80_01830 [Candidatus Buchananbacteria bacterium CG10_big_fil_rev_8_21_14_0_10_33_19]
MLKELEKIDNGFYFNGDDVTAYFYSGTHQIILTGDCVDLALDVLENIENINTLFFDDGIRCYIVAPKLSEMEFFEQVVKVVEGKVGNVPQEDGTYCIRRKIPPTQLLPELEEASIKRLGGLDYYQATVILGRGYASVYSMVDILMSAEGRYTIMYRVQRFNNDVSGAVEDGEAQVFSGAGAQFQAVCFAYSITADEIKTKEAAQRAKHFLYAVVGELMERFWQPSVQPSYFRTWQESNQTASVIV